MAQVVQLFVYHYTDIQKLTLLNFRHVVFSFAHILRCHTLHSRRVPGEQFNL